MNYQAFEYITELFDTTVQKMISDPTEWQAFLRCASWSYNRRFDEQILLFAQRPSATAIAKARVWSDPRKKYCRYVNLGEKGIPVFRNFNPLTMEKQGVEYYFDVEQTHETKSTQRHFSHWKIKEDYEDDIIESLKEPFGFFTDDTTLSKAVMSASANVADNYFLGLYGEEFAEDNRKLGLCSLMENSIAYMLLTRLEIDTEEYLNSADFECIHYIDNENELFSLGNVIRDNAYNGLKSISKKVLELDRNIIQTRRNEYGQGNGRSESENTLQESRGLFSTRLENSPTTRRGTWQVRTTESTMVGEEPAWAVHDVSRTLYNGRETVRERAESVATGGKTYQGTFGTAGTDGRAERERPVEMGSSDEQYQATGGGDSSERSGVQTLNQTDNEKAEDKKSSAFSIPQEVIIDTLTVGTGYENGKYRIYEQFENSLSHNENVDFLKREYGTGGWSDTGGHKGYFCKFNSDGITISHGFGENRTSKTLTWQETAVLIGELIDDYAYLNAKETEYYPTWLKEVTDKRAEIEKISSELKQVKLSRTRCTKNTLSK